MDTSIKQKLQRIMFAEMPRVVIGIVQKVSPIEIVLADDSSIILYDQSLNIPSRFMESNTYTPCAYGSRTCEKCDTACDKLQVGDEVYLLALANDKIYHVLDRV